MLPESFGGRIIYLLQQYGPSFAKGAGVSMWLALVGTLFGCIIGFLVGIVQTIPVDKNDSTAKKVLIKIVKFILACYVEFFRGTPMMAQAMFIYFGSAYLFNINMSMWFGYHERQEGCRSRRWKCCYGCSKNSTQTWR